MNGPRTLAEFKRAIAGGAVVTLVDYQGWPTHRALGVPRTAPEAKPSSTVVVWSDGSRLDFGRASAWTFDPEASTAVLDDGDDGYRLTYSIEEGGG